MSFRPERKKSTKGRFSGANLLVFKTRFLLLIWIESHKSKLGILNSVYELVNFYRNDKTHKKQPSLR